jgi:hypothetical protein
MQQHHALLAVQVLTVLLKRHRAKSVPQARQITTVIQQQSALLAEQVSTVLQVLTFLLKTRGQVAFFARQARQIPTMIKQHHARCAR